MKKRCLSLLLALVMCLALLPATALAADKPEIKWLPNGIEIQAYVPKTDQILAKNGSAWYLLDREGNIVQPLGKAEYDRVYQFQDGMAMVQAGEWPNGKYGYIDENCKLVIPVEYENAHDFSEGLAAVKQDGLWGFIDKTGKMVIPPVYEEVGSFSEGLAPVGMGDFETGVSGYIDKTGKIVIPFEYNYANDFYDGLAMVQKDGKTGYIDKTGKVVIPLQYQGACGNFFEGRAFVDQGDRTGFIDKTGKMVFSYSNSSAEAGEFGYLMRNFSEGLVEITGTADDAVPRYVDQNGKVAFELDAKTVPMWFGFANGVMAVSVDDGSGNWKAGLIDKTGAYVLAPSDEYYMVTYTEPVVYVAKEDLTEGIVQLNAKAPTDPTQPAVEEAMPTNDKLTVNGTLQTPTVYKINGGNYFKLRDLAVLLNGTSCQFDVGYDAPTSSVTASSGKGYAKLESDMQGPASSNQTAVISNDKIIVNGQAANVEVYKIDGGNFFKLRDLGDALGFQVGWDPVNNIASISTNG